MRNKITALALTILLLLTCPLVVFAQEFDQNKTGSICVTLTDQFDKEPIAGAQLCAYYVATVGMDTEGNLFYGYTEPFANSGIALDDPALAAKLDVFVSQNEVASIQLTTNAEGTAVCENLPLGLYFIKQTETVDGFAPCTPFVVTVPGKSDDGYVYQVNASPKTEVAKLTSITIKKVWNTDASTQAADSVTVWLLRDNNVVKTATLNAQNNWQVTFTDMPESDAYSIEEVDIPKGFTATYRQSGYVFTVTNTSTLIQTGQITWPIPVLAISGMLLIGIGMALLQKKRGSDA